jgi:hypothetical protein
VVAAAETAQPKLVVVRAETAAAGMVEVLDPLLLRAQSTRAAVVAEALIKTQTGLEKPAALVLSSSNTPKNTQHSSRKALHRQPQWSVQTKLPL